MIVSRFPQFPHYEISIALYEDVTNVEELRAKANSSLPFALINASLVFSVEQLYSAVYRVLIEHTYNKIQTASFSSECLLRLSASTKVSESQKFGLKYPSNRIICVNIEETTDDSIERPDETIFELVKGKSAVLEDENLSKKCDADTLRKVCPTKLFINLQIIILTFIL